MKDKTLKLDYMPPMEELCLVRPELFCIQIYQMFCQQEQDGKRLQD